MLYIPKDELVEAHFGEAEDDSFTPAGAEAEAERWLEIVLNRRGGWTTNGKKADKDMGRQLLSTRNRSKTPGKSAAPDSVWPHSVIELNRYRGRR